MKKRILTVSVFPLLFMLLGILQGCEDDDDVIIITRYYAYEDAEEAIAVSLSYGTYGMVSNMNRASEEIQENNDCDSLYQKTDSFYDETYTGYISYEYEYQEAYIWSCEPDSKVEYDLSATQHLEVVRANYDHEIELDFDITGLDEANEAEAYSGTYKRTGEWESNYNQETYSFEFDSTLIETLVSKESNKIYAGTATFTLVQNYSYSNVTYTYEGTVEFVSDEEARVEFDSGEVFYVDLGNISIAED
ncbi:hypothetical protein PY092_07440 [Muricauda sp. 334s03]|uniref:DUF4595 domain-containing protein n=1 Tax=Flagellimonas yonaguniensis TaxID=3031325 RepID=A0ABT5XXV5_9FLAO|nr:hypothetical protein [[Muricauda] yonaguniensis]MDF0715975.1 hypothetical protein [[Muricauda] yonaguniensis]